MQMWFAVVLFTVTLAPVAEAACDRPAYHQLDFWIGDWNVVNASGEAVGANRIESILKGCAIQESWTEPSGEEGKSLFYYSPGQSRWKQVWVTDSATALGGTKEKRALPVAGGGMRFQGELVDRDRIILDRTTLTPLADGRVRQVIETSTDGGTIWTVQFDALYERKRRPVLPTITDTPATTGSGALSPSDTAAIRSATLAYRDAWLTNDANRVMATLTPDAVLLPSGLGAIHGSAAIRTFWWPVAAAATTVTAMDLTIETIDGCGDVAFVRGRGTLTFTMAAASGPRSQASTFINVLRRQSYGTWLIAERMWSDVR